jgi:protease-4
MVAESMVWFRGLVADRRRLDTGAVPGLEQGRIFSGREALDYKLIDAIGGEKEAVAWLTEKRGIAKGLKVVDWKPKTADRLGAFGMLARGLAAAFGLDWPAGLVGDGSAFAGLHVGGLVSIWQPTER